MGAMTLKPPGRGGPCLAGCTHPCCERHRLAAAARCQVCNQPLGFGTPVYVYEKRTGHATCLERAVEDALRRLVEGFAELAVDLYLEGKLDLKDEPTSTPTAGTSQRESAAPPPSGEVRGPYLLPRYDMEVEIPSGRTRAPSTSIEDHTTALAQGPRFVVARLRVPQPADRAAARAKAKSSSKAHRR